MCEPWSDGFPAMLLSQLSASFKMAASHESEQTQQDLDRAKGCLYIVTSKPDGQQYHNCREARVRPNIRLVEVFGISRVCTDENAEYFNKITTKKMRAACKMEKRYDLGHWTNF